MFATTAGTHSSRWKTVLRRWCSAALVTAMATALFVLLAPAVSDLLLSHGPYAHPWMTWPVLAIVSIGALILLPNSVAWTRARNQFFNPGPVLLSFIGFLLAIQFWISFPASSPSGLRPALPDDIRLLRTIVATLAGLLGLGIPGAARLVTGLRRKDSSASDKGTELVEFEKIRAWLRTDDEIRHQRQDAFGHAEIARRLAERLSNTRTGSLGRGATFALVGERGAGKSSIRELVRECLEQRGELERHISFVWVSVWPFESADAAIRGILRAIENELRKVTSTISVRRGPDRYLKAIERFDRRFGILSELIAEEGRPDEALSAYDKLAALVGVQIILWVEDLERFEHQDRTPGKAGAPVLALLHQLQQFEHITVVLASASLGTRIDTEKIARFVEIIPRLETGVAWPIVSRFRRGCLDLLREKGHIESAAPSVRKRLSDTEGDAAVERTIGPTASLRGCLVHLFRTPRILKQSLRMTLEVWDRLAGEIDFDDVLLMSVVRSAAPDVFAAVQQHIDVLRDGPSKYRKDDQKDVSAFKSRLDKVVKDGKDRAALDKCLDFVFPNGRTNGSNRRGAKPQGLDAHRHCDYWRRFLGVPLLAEHEKDQRVLRAISAWETSSPSTDLVALVSSPGSSLAVEDFALFIKGPGLIRLLEAVVEARCAERPSAWPEGDFWPEAPGVTEIWRMFRGQHETGVEDQSALACSIERLLSRMVSANLTLAHEVRYLFFTPKEDVFALVSDEDMRRLTTRFEDELRAFSDRGADSLVRALDGASPWTLFWITFGIDRTGEGRRLPPVPFSGWAEFAKVALLAAATEPETMVPQLIPFLVSTKDSLRLKDGEAQETFIFETERAEALFGLEPLADLLKDQKLPAEKLPVKVRERYVFAMNALAEHRRH